MSYQRARHIFTRGVGKHPRIRVASKGKGCAQGLRCTQGQGRHLRTRMAPKVTAAPQKTGVASQDQAQGCTQGYRLHPETRVAPKGKSGAQGQNYKKNCLGAESKTSITNVTSGVPMVRHKLSRGSEEACGLQKRFNHLPGKTTTNV